jgi:hypothetical protein
MPTPLLRGAAAAVQQGDAIGLFSLPANPITDAIVTNLGNSSHLSKKGLPAQMSYGGWKFPEIPAGHPTVIIPVPFPITRTSTPKPAVASEYAQLCAVFFAALFIWMLPSLCINKKLCSPCFTRWLSKQMFCYFMMGLAINITIISIVIANAPHIEANALFFTGVKIIEKVTDSMEKMLMQLGALAALVALYAFRKKILTILGFEQQVVRADLRDLLTGFSMKRFQPIEISLWYADGLPCGFSKRSIFTRILLGYNEPQHGRPHDGVRDSVAIRERMQMNYDPEDVSQKLTIMIKQQEILGTSVNQMLPAAGAVMGALGGMVSPLGTGPGAALGVVTGTGAAHSVGQEVARVELSSMMVNRIRERCNASGPADHPKPDSERRKALKTSAKATVEWSEEAFQKVDLVPQGNLWLRITDLGV